MAPSCPGNQALFHQPPALPAKTGLIDARIDDGAVDETRTRDLNLGKVALYQLSYYRILNAFWHGSKSVLPLCPIPA